MWTPPKPTEEAQPTDPPKDEGILKMVRMRALALRKRYFGRENSLADSDEMGETNHLLYIKIPLLLL